MKFNFTYLILSIAFLAAGCVGSNKTAAPVPAPFGSFAGQYRLIHIHNNGTKDTLKANLTVNLATAGTYTVTGDTATVHAGSLGTFIGNTNDNVIIFTDKTYPKTGTPTKAHLNGLYNYFYQGDIFQMVAYGPADTIVYQYDLKKAN